MLLQEGQGLRPEVEPGFDPEPLHLLGCRPIDGEWPYLWLDATYLKVRDSGRIVSVAAIIAVAVATEGRREIIGWVSARPKPNRSGRRS
jgi:transposase-like protein